jgi:hypothetical protein
VNWEAIGAVSETIGAIAVIITLVYLAIQIRQNTSTLKSGATQGAHDQSSQLYETLASDPDLGEIFARGLEAPDTLDQRETARFFAVLMSASFKLQNWYLQTRSGAIDEELFESWIKVTRQLSGLPGFRRFWSQRGHLFFPEFSKYLEEEVFVSERDPSYKPLGVKRSDTK